MFLSESYPKSLMEGGSRYVNPQSVFLFRQNYLHSLSRVYINEDEETEEFVFWVGCEQGEK